MFQKRCKPRQVIKILSHSCIRYNLNTFLTLNYAILRSHSVIVFTNTQEFCKNIENCERSLFLNNA